jgi:hypothetical protein
MTDDLKNSTSLTPIDSFGFVDGYVDEAEGEEELTSNSLLQGTTRIEFSLNYKWLNHADKTELPPERNYVFDHHMRVAVKFVDGNLVDQEILSPGQKFPNFKERNAKCPQSEWKEHFGKLRGPWSGQIIVLLIDPNTVDQFSWVAKLETKGARIAVNDLLDRIKRKQLLFRAPVVPILRLGQTIMPSREYGPRPRPHFIIGQQWVARNSGVVSATQALPAPVTLALPTAAENSQRPAATPQQQLEQFSGSDPAKSAPAQMQTIEPQLQTVDTPSLREELKDEIPF